MTPFDGGKAVGSSARPLPSPVCRSPHLTSFPLPPSPFPSLPLFARAEAKKRLGKKGKKEPSPSPFLAVPAGQRPVEMGRGRGTVSPAGKRGNEGRFDEGDFFAGREFGGDMRQEGDREFTFPLILSTARKIRC